MGLCLERVRQGLELGRISAGSMRQRLAQQPVGQPRVARQQGAVQVRANRPPDAAALEGALAVVAEACDDPSQRLGACIEKRAPSMVLEPGKRPPLTGDELTIEEDVADHPALAGDRLERKEADSRQLGAASLAIEPAEQLVTAADGKHRRARLHRLHQTCFAGEIPRDERLLAILPPPT